MYISLFSEYRTNLGSPISPPSSRLPLTTEHCSARLTKAVWYTFVNNLRGKVKSSTFHSAACGSTFAKTRSCMHHAMSHVLCPVTTVGRKSDY